MKRSVAHYWIGILPLLPRRMLGGGGNKVGKVMKRNCDFLELRSIV